MCSDMLEASGVPSKLVVIHDNNDIDREVTAYRPSHVIIEALWVVPEKFEVLTRLHPDVMWIVRLHSDLPFLATEGVAVDWIRRYIRYPQVVVAANSHRAWDGVRMLVAEPHQQWQADEILNKVWYLPNFYPVPSKVCVVDPYWSDLNVGCFGAIRPLKNQLIQAVAAVQLTQTYKKKNLWFHVNATRLEQMGGNVLRNMEALFNRSGARLVKHPWMNRNEFLAQLKGMDVAMCVSLSETFCVVAADAVASGVPLVCSAEVSWAREGVANPFSVNSIVDALNHTLDHSEENVRRNSEGLARHSKISRSRWLEHFQK
jgi:glycosyltransferase involved in cell wall biosynthesis